MSWNNIVPWDVLFPQAACKVCKHKFYCHENTVGCVGPTDPKEDTESFWKGTCKFDCKKYCETNLEYLEYKYEQKYHGK